MKYYIIDVFTKERYRGNPAGVCLLDSWPEDEIMQNIACETNFADTAFLVKNAGYYDLRWFSPGMEIDLCGHATLASAYVLMNYVDQSMRRVDFHTKSGVLTVTRDGELFTMDFPSRKPSACEISPILEEALGVKVLETLISRDLLVVIEDAETLKKITPDLSLLSKIDNVFGFIVTARGDDCDFVSRFFAPNGGIPEDPVTGSSHTTLIPYWSEMLDKDTMTAKQLSKRGGALYCRNRGERVEISGNAVTFLIGEIVE